MNHICIKLESIAISVMNPTSLESRLFGSACIGNSEFKSIWVQSEDGRIGRVGLGGSDTTLPIERSYDSLLWQFVGHGTMVSKNPSRPPEGFYGVVALWPVDVKAESAFEKAALENAEMSVTQEDDCMSFGVFRAAENSNIFVLFELFCSKSSFYSHLDTIHFNKFRSKARPIFRGNATQTLKGSVVRTC